MKMPTIQDIADEAGVSKRVVSAILNNKENQKIFVSQRKKELILSVIERTAYVPNKRARDLSSQRTNTIGIIFHNLPPYYALLLEELQAVAFSSNIEIMPYLTRGQSSIEEKYFNLMRDGRVDGVITAAFLDDSTERYIKFSSPPYNLKIVTISPPVKGIPSVNCDEWKAGEIVAEHLIEIGCRQFVFFGGGKDFGRYGGFSEYLTQKGFVKPECFYETGYVGEFGKARKLAIKLLEGKKKFDGVFAHNDIYATALKMEALRKGIRIPDDLAIVGYDNTNVCEMSQPTLSSIDTNPLMLVKTALDKLSRLIDNSMKDEENTKIQPNLIIRESSGGVMKNLNLEKNLELVRNGKKNARNRKE